MPALVEQGVNSQFDGCLRVAGGHDDGHQRPIDLERGCCALDPVEEGTVVARRQVDAEPIGGEVFVQVMPTQRRGLGGVVRVEEIEAVDLGALGLGEGIRQGFGALTLLGELFCPVDGVVTDGRGLRVGVLVQPEP